MGERFLFEVTNFEKKRKEKKTEFGKGRNQTEIQADKASSKVSESSTTIILNSPTHVGIEMARLLKPLFSHLKLVIGSVIPIRDGRKTIDVIMPGTKGMGCDYLKCCAISILTALLEKNKKNSGKMDSKRNHVGCRLWVRVWYWGRRTCIYYIDSSPAVGKLIIQQAATAVHELHAA